MKFGKINHFTKERMAPMKNSLAPSIVKHDSKKGRKFFSIAETAYDNAGMSEDEAQNVNEAPGLADLIANFIAENRLPKLYANEECKSGYTYPKEYKGPKPIADQIKAIADIFGLNSADALEYANNLPELPKGAEGWFAIPSVDAIAAKHFPEIIDPAEKYCAAVRLVLEKIAATRNFHNYRDGQINSAHLRVHAKTVEALKAIAKVQKGDILIVAAQIGFLHRGRSTRRARAIFAKNEFSLGSLAIGSIALTHPERFVRLEELDIFCAGDEFSPDADGRFVRVPSFSFGGDRLEFGAHDAAHFDECYGAASAFLPQ